MDENSRLPLHSWYTDPLDLSARRLRRFPGSYVGFALFNVAIIAVLGAIFGVFDLVFPILLVSSYGTLHASVRLDFRKHARCYIIDPCHKIILYPEGYRVGFKEISPPRIVRVDASYVNSEGTMIRSDCPAVSVGEKHPLIRLPSKTSRECEDAIRVIAECQREASRADAIERHRGEALEARAAPPLCSRRNIQVDPSTFPRSNEALRDHLRWRRYHPPFQAHRWILHFVPWSLVLLSGPLFWSGRMSWTGPVFGEDVGPYFFFLLPVSMVMLGLGWFLHTSRDGVFEIDPGRGILRERRSNAKEEVVVQLASIKEPFIRTIDFGGPDALDGNPKPAIYHFLVLNDESNVVLELPGLTPEQIEEFAQLLLRIQAAIAIRAALRARAAKAPA